jgi:hypothetical protein
MPTLFRLLITLLFLAGLVYAGMIALVAFVQPDPRETVIRIPQRDFLGDSAPNLPTTGQTLPQPGVANGTAPAPENAATPAAP